MKTNTKDRPFHLHVEYFFRQQYCLLAMLALMLVAMAKTDGRFFGLVRQAYAQGFGIVGQYMREETTRVPVTFNNVAKLPTSSGSKGDV